MHKATLLAALLGLVAAAGASPDDAKTDKDRFQGTQQPPESKQAVAAREPELRKELLERMKEDQEFRRRLMPLLPEQAEGDAEAKKEVEELWKKGHEIDRRNTAWVKGVIERHGWPGYDQVGTDGGLAVFLLVQHAVSDPAFMKQCLPLLEAAVKKKQAS